MDTKAFYKLSYGVFVLSAKDKDVKNACITNTCIQVASNPTRIAISVINANYTCELIKNSASFVISILDDKVSFDTIKHFGMQSGRDVDKFKGIEYKLSKKGIPYITENVAAVLNCNVLSQEDLGSHTLFIAEVEDAEVINSSSTPLTYSYYQSHIKPKAAAPATSKKITGWRCKICGYVYKGESLPNDFLCPLCAHDASDFEPIYE